jgi:hypothetical protein
MLRYRVRSHAPCAAERRCFRSSGPPPTRGGLLPGSAVHFGALGKRSAQRLCVESRHTAPEAIDPPRMDFASAPGLEQVGDDLAHLRSQARVRGEAPSTIDDGLGARQKASRSRHPGGPPPRQRLAWSASSACTLALAAGRLFIAAWSLSRTACARRFSAALAMGVKAPSRQKHSTNCFLIAPAPT